jgi:predicted Zn-dependent protease
LLIWSAIIDSSWAGAKGGLGALSLVKQARSDLEKRSASTPMLYKVQPGPALGRYIIRFPAGRIGFGDKNKAEEMLKKALAINPDGIDPNYFYGDFLLKEKKTGEGKRYLEKGS